jgi:hypothetical protein
MTARRPPGELLQQEVRELTDLLRHADSFADLRGALAGRGVPASETILAGLYESEDYSKTGVILTASQECIRFEPPPTVRLRDGILSMNLMLWRLTSRRFPLESP